MNLYVSKKGQVQNYIAVIIVLLMFGITSLIGTLIFLEMKTAFQDGGLYEGDIEETGEAFLSSLQAYDHILVVILVFLIIGVGISSYRLNVSPVYFIFSLIMIFFLGFVSYFFNFLFQQIVSQSVFNTVTLLFPRTISICTNFHWVALVTFIIGSITLWLNIQNGMFYCKKERGELVE